jgi:hypothetical protein
MTADPTYNAKVYAKQGGDVEVVASGGQITVESLKAPIKLLVGHFYETARPWSASTSAARPCRTPLGVSELIAGYKVR